GIVGVEQHGQAAGEVGSIAANGLQRLDSRRHLQVNQVAEPLLQLTRVDVQASAPFNACSSHARANSRSRLTVARLMPSATATSSRARPPKARNTIASAWRGCSAPRAARARSRS